MMWQYVAWRKRTVAHKALYTVQTRDSMWEHSMVAFYPSHFVCLSLSRPLSLPVGVSVMTRTRTPRNPPPPHTHTHARARRRTHAPTRTHTRRRTPAHAGGRAGRKRTGWKQIRVPQAGMTFLCKVRPVMWRGGTVSCFCCMKQSLVL